MAPPGRKGTPFGTKRRPKVQPNRRNPSESNLHHSPILTDTAAVWHRINHHVRLVHRILANGASPGERALLFRSAFFRRLCDMPKASSLASDRERLSLKPEEASLGPQKSIPMAIPAMFLSFEHLDPMLQTCLSFGASWKRLGPKRRLAPKIRRAEEVAVEGAQALPIWSPQGPAK